MTATWWEGPYFHPKDFAAEEVSTKLIGQLRLALQEEGSKAGPMCSAAAALRSGAVMFNLSVAEDVMHR